MEHQNKTRFRDIINAKNAQSNVIETRLPIEKKYSIHIPFEVMDFLGNDYVIVSPKRFSRIKAFRYLLSRHIDGLEKGELKRNYISQLCKDWKWTRPLQVFGGVFFALGMLCKLFEIIGKVSQDEGFWCRQYLSLLFAG